MTKEKGFQRVDGRKLNELRKMSAKVGVIPNADGSAMFAFGNTIAIAAVYGPRLLHPQHMQDPSTGILRVTYDLMSFSVNDRKKPGPSRRSQEISKMTEYALIPVLNLKEFPNTVIDVQIYIIQADAGTRTAGINAASMALAHAGIPMKNLICSVAIGKQDENIVVDLNKAEEEHPGIKTNILQTFDKLVPILKKDIKHGGELFECKICGEPSSERICKTCQLWKEI